MHTARRFDSYLTRHDKADSKQVTFAPQWNNRVDRPFGRTFVPLLVCDDAAYSGAVKDQLIIYSWRPLRSSDIGQKACCSYAQIRSATRIYTGQKTSSAASKQACRLDASSWVGVFVPTSMTDAQSVFRRLVSIQLDAIGCPCRPTVRFGSIRLQLDSSARWLIYGYRETGCGSYRCKTCRSRSINVGLLYVICFAYCLKR